MAYGDNKMEIEKNTSKKRGTDEAFLQLMSICGGAVLKLLGVPPDEAERYLFRAVVLKEKRVEPDVEGFPLLESEGRRAFIEFQGWLDKFIRYKLGGKVFIACSQENYEGKVFAGIIFTEKRFRDAALPLNPFMETDKCCLSECFTEIVLTDYTEEELIDIDPRLVVLAPFTLTAKTEDTTQILSKGRKWKETITKVFPTDRRKDALNVLCLLLLNRFRDISREEVIGMMNFDLLDTRAGQDILKEGKQLGAVDMVRSNVIEALEERFQIVPTNIIDRINAIGRREILKGLHRQAIRCGDLEGFNEVLARAT